MMPFRKFHQSDSCGQQKYLNAYISFLLHPYGKNKWKKYLFNQLHLKTESPLSQQLSETHTIFFSSGVHCPEKGHKENVCHEVYEQTQVRGAQ